MKKSTDNNIIIKDIIEDIIEDVINDIVILDMLIYETIHEFFN